MSAWIMRRVPGIFSATDTLVIVTSYYWCKKKMPRQFLIINMRITSVEYVVINIKKHNHKISEFCKLAQNVCNSKILSLIQSSSSCHAIRLDISEPRSPPTPYLSLLLADPQGYIKYRHRAAVCRFELDVLPLLVNVKGSTGVHHLRGRPYFSSSVLQVWIV